MLEVDAVVDTVPVAEVVASVELVTTVPEALSFSAEMLLMISTLSTVADDMNNSLSSAKIWNNDPNPDVD